MGPHCLSCMLQILEMQVAPCMQAHSRQHCLSHFLATWLQVLRAVGLQTELSQDVFKAAAQAVQAQYNAVQQQQERAPQPGQLEDILETGALLTQHYIGNTGTYHTNQLYMAIRELTFVPALKVCVAAFALNMGCLLSSELICRTPCCLQSWVGLLILMPVLEVRSIATVASGGADKLWHRASCCWPPTVLVMCFGAGSAWSLQCWREMQYRHMPSVRGFLGGV